MNIRRVAFHNLGCKVNSYETEAMMQALEKEGYTMVPFEEQADAYVINTCTVTNIADRKSRQMLHRAKKRNPEALVIAAGCYAQMFSEELAADESVDMIIGNQQKQFLAEYLKAYEEEHAQAEKKIYVQDLNKKMEYEPLELHRTAEHTRAYIKVQDGCNQFCSYCMIPYARGRVRSRNLEDISKEVKELAEAGYREIVLTGIHLSSYGIDKSEETNLTGLIEKIHETEGIERIRLGSLEPRIITEDFIQRMSVLPKLCPHFHLALQSGCDETLKRMNRRYDTAEYYEKCLMLREAFDRPALTTDVIVGFPQESEQEFAATVEFLKKVRFYETHIFKYSRRKGTRADAMDGQIAEEIKNKRSHILLELNRKNQWDYIRSFIGESDQVLFEEQITENGQVFDSGYTRRYIRVNKTAGAESLTGKIRDCILYEPDVKLF